MRTSIFVLTLLAGCTLLQAGTPVSSAGKNAAPTGPATFFGGPLLERSMLTGNWDGARDDLANIALTPWAHLTLDAQVVDPVIQRADTAVVLGTRLVITF